MPKKFNDMKLFTILLAITLPGLLPKIVVAAVKCLLLLWITVLEIREIVKTEKNRHNISVWFVLGSLVVVCAYQLLINILNNGDLLWTMLLGTIMVLIIYFDYVRLTKNEKLIELFVEVCNIWIIISLADVIAKKITAPDMHYLELLICGYSNGLGASIPPVLALNFFFLKKNRKNRLLLVGSVSGLIQIGIVYPMTAIVAVVLIFGYSFFFRYRWFRKIATSTVFLLLSIAVFLMFPVFSIYKNPVTEFIIVNILHKDMTLSHRTNVWSSAIAMIKESPVLGYGSQVAIQKEAFKIANCHNYYLDILFRSGMIGLVLTLLNYVADIIFVRKNGNENAKWLAGAYFLLLIPWQFESYFNYKTCPLFCVILLYALCVKDLEENNVTSNKHSDDSN